MRLMAVDNGAYCFGRLIHNITHSSKFSLNL
jgi:hypothetical protein